MDHLERVQSVVGRVAIGLVLCSALMAGWGCRSGETLSLRRKDPLASGPALFRPGKSAEQGNPNLGKGRSDILLATGQLLENQGKLADAAELYKQAIELDGSRPEAYHRLGLVLDKMGKGEEARKNYRLAAKYDPNNPVLYNDYGYSCYLERRWAEAEAAYRKALELSPNFTRARNNLALVYARTGRPAEALEEFARAGCGEAEARANLALALATEGRIDEAMAEYQRALALNPSLASAHEGLASLRRVHGQAEQAGWALAADESSPSSVQTTSYRQPVLR